MTERESQEPDPPLDFFKDAPDTAEASKVTLERLTDLALQARQLEIALLAKQLELDDLSKKYLKIVRDLIPSIMDELGMESYKLKDGSQIAVKDDVKCSIPEENRSQAWVWLEERDYDGIIKTHVSISFGKGEINVAKEAMDKIRELGFAPELDRNVHPQTLKAFVKERLEAGEELPLDTFSIFQFKQAKITLPKPTRATSSRKRNGQNDEAGDF